MMGGDPMGNPKSKRRHDAERLSEDQATWPAGIASLWGRISTSQAG
jgi:hypothetical protein